MLLGALLHCGVDRNRLLQDLEKLGLDGLEFTVSTTRISSIAAYQVNICSSKRQELRHLPGIVRILENSGLPPEIIQRSISVFTTLAEAEAKVHGIDIEKVHFHEVGALDTIVDIVGVVLCLSYLNITKIICSPLPTGHGFVKCDHGLLPLPAPAVCELLVDVPTYGINLQQELITPTGAALIKTLTDDFGVLPPMRIQATGYGAGTRTLDNNQPNLLRCILGEHQEVSEEQRVDVIECNLDDWNPEGFPHLCTLLFEQGALDVTLTPNQMKKGRPGFTLQVITRAPFSHSIKNTIFSETSSIGLRFRQEHRMTLARKKVTVPTIWGEIEAKEVTTPEGSIIYPEYEECRKVAQKHKVPLQEVYHQVQSYRKLSK